METAEEMVKIINSTLEGFHIDARCVFGRTHHHFGLYDLKLGPKCQVAKLQKYANEIALRLRCRTTPIIKAIPEQGIVRLQAVLSEPKPILFNEAYHSENKPNGLLPFYLGETDEGNEFWVDMAQNPHALVAGSTNSGKSVFLHNLIANASRIKGTVLALSDPKGVEFAPYRNSKLSNFINTIASSYDETVRMLDNLVCTMESRYRILMNMGIQSIDQMISPFDKIMVIIDEVADLILMDGRNHRFEELVVKLAQKSRAAGIYLVLATQRPSVDVLTGLIKANFDARLACRVSSRVDSSVILDQPGAEHLLGRGDAIFRNRQNDSVRLQIAFTKPSDVIEHYLSIS